MKPITLPSPSGKLSEEIKGLWLLQSREDYTSAGQQRIDPTLGKNPLGILAYSATHFTAQFMKRDRSDKTQNVSYAGSNNTVASDGYDAYFGTYLVDEATGRVKHTLMGSVTEGNIGISVWRDLRVIGDQLIIQLDTTTLAGEAIVRTLIWRRD